jgi:hypothetical protein
MNEERTTPLPDNRSFEDRVFARFDAIDDRFERFDARFVSLDQRLEKLEARNYDTKPIWERALKAIMDTGLDVGEIKTKVGVIEGNDGVIEGKVGVIEGKVQSLDNEVGSMKITIRNGLVDVRRELKHHVGERLDMILKLLIEDREDIRDAEDRIRDLESKLA